MDLLILEGQDHLGVAHREALLGDQDLDVGVEVEQAHGIGDAGAVLADAGGDLLLLERVFLGQPDIAGGFLHRVEVFALDVFDEGHFEHVAVGRLAFDHRDGGEAEFVSGAPAAFAGDEFEAAVDQTHDERLDDAVLADRFDEVVERSLEKLGARLQRAWHHLLVRDIPHPFQIIRRHPAIIRWSGGMFPDESCESFAECLCRFSHGAEPYQDARRNPSGIAAGLTDCGWQGNHRA